jgi:site-specific recombinase XerD
MRSTFKILFYLNTSKRKKSGLCPVMGRITVDGGIAQFSLKEDAHEAHWDAQKGRVKGKTREQIELNRKIEQTEQFIRNIYTRTVETTGYVTAEQIKNELTGVTTKSETLLELFKEHNRDFKERVGIDREERTYNHYELSYNHLSRFIQSKYRVTDYPLNRLDLSFIEDYDCFLRVDAHLCTNTMVKHIIYLKKMIIRAMNQKIIMRDPFQEYIPSKKKSKYRHISKQELERMMTTQIKSKAVSCVRDMFVFSCFTGLAYADIVQLSEKHLRKAEDGSIWIEIHRYKTDVESNIRLLDIPLAIIEKYQPERKGEEFFKLPNSGAISRTMRKIETLCSINHLHFHMARHTFATLICMTNGVSMEAVSKMMGHSTMRTTQIYAEITNQRVSDDMQKLAKRIKRKNREKTKIMDN